MCPSHLFATSYGNLITVYPKFIHQILLSVNQKENEDIKGSVYKK
jgi:hypothetical protein